MFFSQKDAMLREYQSEIEKLKQMIEKGGFEGGEVVEIRLSSFSDFLSLIIHYEKKLTKSLFVGFN